MAQTKANDINIEYETRGDVRQPTLVLIRGLGTQLSAWPEAYLTAITDAGFHVVIFDNRDVGLSQKFGDFGPASLVAVLEDLRAGKTPDLAYTVDDMAADIVGLMDALGIDKAHICGMSMGGMIAQVAAINHGDRLLSATSIMSGTGDPSLPQSTPEARKALLDVAPSKDPDDIIAFNIRGAKVNTGKGRPMPDDLIAKQQRIAVERCYYPEGVGRQYVAIVASGDRSDACRSIDVPFLVIHGTDDPLVRVEAGVDTADKVPGAKLHLIEGMGHDLPPSCCGEITGMLIEFMRGLD